MGSEDEPPVPKSVNPKPPVRLLNHAKGWLRDQCLEAFKWSKLNIDDAIRDALKGTPASLQTPKQKQASSECAGETSEAGLGDYSFDSGAEGNPATPGTGTMIWRYSHRLEFILNNYLSNAELSSWRARIQEQLGQNQAELKKRIFEHLRAGIAQKLKISEPALLKWLENLNLPMEIESASRACLLQMLFCRVEQVSARAGLLIELIEKIWSLQFSRKIADTIRLNYRDLEDLHYKLQGLSIDISLWFFASVANGHFLSPGDDIPDYQLDTLDEEPVRAGSADPPTPFTWDPWIDPLARILKGVVLGQSSNQKRFLFGAFLSSPAGKLLRTNNLARLIPVKLNRIGPCSHCGERYTFLSVPPTSCSHCHAAEPIYMRGFWLIAIEQIEAGMFQPQLMNVCSNRKCRHIQTVKTNCHECSSPITQLDTFVLGKGVPLDAYPDYDEETDQLNAEKIKDDKADGGAQSAVHERLIEPTGRFITREINISIHVIQTTKAPDKQNAMLRRILLIWTMARVDGNDITDRTRPLSQEQVLTFLDNLASQDSLSELQKSINAEVHKVASILHLEAAHSSENFIEQGNITVIKHRLRRDLIAFLKGEGGENEQRI